MQIATRTIRNDIVCRRFASTRSVQIATFGKSCRLIINNLCLHTLRADCNADGKELFVCCDALPPHAPCRLQHAVISRLCAISALPPHAPCRLQLQSLGIIGTAYALPPHAPCRLQQAAEGRDGIVITLCLHTLRADCNIWEQFPFTNFHALPPHAPCRLQQCHTMAQADFDDFASTRSVQIATKSSAILTWYATALPPHAPCRLQRLAHLSTRSDDCLCLHTLRADCNLCAPGDNRACGLCLHTLRADCNVDRLSGKLMPSTLPPHAPCRLQRANWISTPNCASPLPPHAPCRLQRCLSYAL